MLTPQPYPQSWAVPPRRGSHYRRTDSFTAWTHIAQGIACADPLPVFQELAGWCVPAVCDHAAVEVVAGDQLAFWAAHNMMPTDSSVATYCLAVAAAHHTVSVSVAGDVDRAGRRTADPDYFAMLTCTWHSGSHPTDTEVALVKMLARHSQTVIDHARESAAQQRQIANLQVALETNRNIGAAVGVVMATSQLTYEQAFGLLRKLSQDSNRKLADVAAQVLRTGAPEGGAADCG